jgi:hypothetical protein
MQIPTSGGAPTSLAAAYGHLSTQGKQHALFGTRIRRAVAVGIGRGRFACRRLSPHPVMGMDRRHAVSALRACHGRLRRLRLCHRHRHHSRCTLLLQHHRRRQRHRRCFCVPSGAIILTVTRRHVRAVLRLSVHPQTVRAGALDGLCACSCSNPHGCMPTASMRRVVWQCPSQFVSTISPGYFVARCGGCEICHGSDESYSYELG